MRKSINDLPLLVDEQFDLDLFKVGHPESQWP